MKLSLASIRIYPIKSLGGVEVPEAMLTDRGLQHDRRWMLVDENGVFMSQREVPQMACLQCTARPDGFDVVDRRNGDRIQLPWELQEGEPMRVEVWSDRVKALRAGNSVDDRFSEMLKRQVRLVYMPETSRRRTDGRYAKALNSFSDGFPYLIASQRSLDELNDRLHANGGGPVPMDRFRPNLVIAGGGPFQEDRWQHIRIGGVPFQLVKPCARCVIVTTDQQTAARSAEPLRTLATFRRKGKKVLFGVNAVALGDGGLRIGAPVELVPAEVA